MIEILDCEQNSEAWKLARIGLPTASEFHAILAKGEGKTRRAYLYRLAAERLTGEPTETFVNAAMERGHLMEDEARDAYVFQCGAEVQRVGFVRNGGKGCSPDSLIGTDGGLEIKSAASHIQVERLMKGDLPPEYRAQVQGSMWVCERDWWSFVSYCPRLPLLIVNVQRDNGYIATLAGEVARFNDELAATVELVRAYGRKEAA